MSRRVVALANVQMVRSEELDEAFTAAWKKLIVQEEITCAMTQERFPPVIKPQAAILDVSVVRASSGRLDGSPNTLFAHKPVRDLRAISGKDVKIYS